MDHIVYLDHNLKALDYIIKGKKTMILRGAMDKKIPYEKVQPDDDLYFVENKGDHLIKVKARVVETFFSKQLTWDESFQLVDQHEYQLYLNTALKKKYAGKRYITLITFDDVSLLDPPIEVKQIAPDKSIDWISTQMIDNIVGHAKL